MEKETNERIIEHWGVLSLGYVYEKLATCGHINCPIRGYFEKILCGYDFDLCCHRVSLPFKILMPLNVKDSCGAQPPHNPC